MEFNTKTHGYAVRKVSYDYYQAIMVISEHTTENDALDAMLNAMNKDSVKLDDECQKEMNQKGIQAISFEEAKKEMSPEQLERFMKEREKHVKPRVIIEKGDGGFGMII